MRTKKDYRQASLATYKLFKKEHKGCKLTFDEFDKIIYTFNEKFYEYLLETGLPLKLPRGLGTFVVSKRKPVVKEVVGKDGVLHKVDTRPIDYAASKKYGKKIYHLNDHSNGYRFNYRWSKTNARFLNKFIWSFKPFRLASRTLTHYIKNKPEIAAKYSIWTKNATF